MKLGKGFSEFLVLRAFFGIKEKKKLLRLQTEYEKDMRIDCVSGLVKRATNLFQGVS
jgi:hypothetical protein